MTVGHRSAHFSPDLSEESPWRQVAAQVILLERTIERVCESLGPEHMLTVRYEEFCASPQPTVEAVRELLGSKGFEPALRVRELPPFAKRRSELEAEYGPRVEQAFDELSGELSDLEPTGNSS